MTWSTDPSKNVLKNPSPNSMVRPSNLIYCGWTQTKSVGSVFYNQHINKVNPHFSFMRRAQNADTHAVKQPRLSQNIFPVCSSFVLVITSDMHLESESKKKKNERKTLIYTQLKISRYNRHFFAIFRWILTNWPPTYLMQSDHCRYWSFSFLCFQFW